MNTLKRAEELLTAEREDFQKLHHAANTLCEIVRRLEAENTALRGVVEKVRKGCGVLISPTDETGHTAKAIDAGQREAGRYILSIISEVPK